MSELLLGCGHQRRKVVVPPGAPSEWQELVTCDLNSSVKPDLLCNLDVSRFKIWHVQDFTDCGGKFLSPSLNKIEENVFQEVHAYELLEHLGTQGDVGSFFHTFSNIYRVLLPSGYLCATVPSRFSPWLWGDPGHRRVIYRESLSFLDQTSYAQLGHTVMSDYREYWSGDFKLVSSTDDKVFHTFILQAIKPARKLNGSAP